MSHGERSHGDVTATGGTAGSGGSAASGGSSGGFGGSAGSGGSSGSFGGGAGAGGHASGSGGAGSAGSPPNSGFFIEGLFDGERIVAETDVGARWFQGLAMGWLELQARGGDDTWFIYVREGTVNQTCGAATVTLMRQDAGNTAYFLSGWNADVNAPCTLIVAEPPGPVGEVIEGTFAASLSPLGQEGSLAEGSFRVPRLPNEPPAE